MSLDRTARAILDERGVRYVLIGAAALGIYGLIRSTNDTDFLTVDRSVPDGSVGTPVELEGAKVVLLQGDFTILFTARCASYARRNRSTSSSAMEMGSRGDRPR